MNITVTGPRSVGKTTLCKILADKIGFEYVESDALLDKNLQDLGGLSKAIEKDNNNHILKLGCKLYSELLSGDKILFDMPGGAINKKINNQTEFKQKNREIISSKSVVVGLLPFEDDDKSIEFLFSREKSRKHFLSWDSKELYEKVKKDYLALKDAVIQTSSVLIWTFGRESHELVDEVVEKLDF